MFRSLEMAEGLLDEDEAATVRERHEDRSLTVAALKNSVDPRHGLLIPTKLPSLSRASAHRNAPTSGLSK